MPADIADYRRAVEEFFLEHSIIWTNRPERAFRRYLEEQGSRTLDTASNAGRRMIRPEGVLSVPTEKIVVL